MNNPKHLSDADLRKAFDAFMQISGELDQSYRNLEKRVSVLNGELASAKEASRREQDEKNRLAHRVNELIELLPGGVMVLDTDNRIKECNHAAETFFGQNLEGKDWIAVYLEECDEVPDSTGECHLKNGQVLTIKKVSLQHGDRLLLATDITDSHQHRVVQARRVRMERLGEMAACLAHQIRTPLSSATLYLSQLGHKSLDADDRLRLQVKLNDSLSHMANLVARILDVSRDRGVPEDEISIHLLMSGFENLIAPQLEQVKGVMSMSLPKEDYLVRADLEDLSGVLVNIGMNATQWAGVGARLSVEVRRTKRGCIEIVLSDNGPGIGAEVIEHIFDPFFTTRAAGNGLGLAVAANVVESLGGQIRARNLNIGGAEFSLELPATPAKDKGKRKEANDPQLVANEVAA